MRVLIVKTSSMGDILHTLPALTDAQNALPEVHFDWVVEENFAEIPQWHSAVENVIPVALRRWRKSWFKAQTRQERAAFIRQLKTHNYDAIIDAQGLFKSAFFVTRKANGLKHGQDFRSAREPIASWFFDVKHFIPKKQHAVERTRQLFAASLGYSFPNHKGDYGIAGRFVHPENQHIAEPYLVFLHATTRYDKHWTEQRWRELIALTKNSELRIKLPWGTQQEQERALRLAKYFHHVEVLPKLSLTEIAQVLANAHAVVSVDTGLSHLTAALNRPNITLYGPTNPGLIGGYGENQYALCAENKNLASIDAERVQNNLVKILR